MSATIDTRAAGATTQRAWVCRTAPASLEAGMDLLSAAPHPRPVPEDSLGPNEVLVRVTYAALNPAEYKLPELGRLAAWSIFGRFFIPGQDFAGVVAGVGANVLGDYGHLTLGTPVFGRVAFPPRFGALAEYVVVDKDGCAPIPDGVAPTSAACVPTAGLTAYASLAKYVGSGDAVFINGGSGGVGSFAIQIAKALGCSKVIVSCSAVNAALCRRLGADEVIDYRTQDVCAELRAKGPVFDVVIDNVGNSPADLYKAADGILKAGSGVFVQVGAAMSLAGITGAMARALMPGFLGNGHRRFVFPVAACTRADLETVAGWIREGKVKAVVDELFDYTNAVKAYARLRKGNRSGKIVIKVGNLD